MAAIVGRLREQRHSQTCVVTLKPLSQIVVTAQLYQIAARKDSTQTQPNNLTHMFNIR